MYVVNLVREAAHGTNVEVPIAYYTMKTVAEGVYMDLTKRFPNKSFNMVKVDEIPLVDAPWTEVLKSLENI